MQKYVGIFIIITIIIAIIIIIKYHRLRCLLNIELVE